MQEKTDKCEPTNRLVVINDFRVMSEVQEVIKFNDVHVYAHKKHVYPQA